MGGVEKFLLYHRNSQLLYEALKKATPHLTEAQIRMVLCINRKKIQPVDLSIMLQMTPQSAGQLINRSGELLEAGELDQDDLRVRAQRLSETGLEALELLKAVLESDEVKAILE